MSATAQVIDIRQRPVGREHDEWTPLDTDKLVRPYCIWNTSKQEFYKDGRKARGYVPHRRYMVAWNAHLAAISMVMLGKVPVGTVLEVLDAFTEEMVGWYVMRASGKLDHWFKVTSLQEYYE